MYTSIFIIILSEIAQVALIVAILGFIIQIIRKRNFRIWLWIAAFSLLLILVSYLAFGWWLGPKKKSPEEPWEKVVSLIRECKVWQVSQTHSLSVLIYLDFGSSIISTEPYIDAIIEEAEGSEKPCNRKIIVITE